MEETARILLVDDDIAIRELLQEYLSEQGFEVDSLPDGSALADSIEHFQPNLVIMDLMLPGEDGLSLVRKVKSHNDLPVIILSARGDEIDRIVGLEVGADDYLAKPFNPRELLARIRAVLRRNEPATSTEAPSEANIYRFADFEFNRESRILSRQGQDLELTTGDAALLDIFIQHAGRLLSRDQLMDFISGNDRMPFDRSIDVRITRLRGKIEQDSKKPRFIRTVWGKGYLFSPTGDAA